MFHHSSIAAFIIFLTITGGTMAAQDPKPLDPKVDKVLSVVHWYGQDAIRVDGTKAVVYFDPWQLPKGAPAADLVLVTHDHADHCSPQDVQAITKPGTTVVTVAAAAKKLSGNVKVVKPGDALTIGGVHITVIPAYNINKFRSPGQPFHPKEAGFAGYIVDIDGVRVYHAGDSDFTPEMGLVKADIALLPVSGTYVMTAEEAAKAADAIKAAVTIPMHVGRGIGSLADRAKFQSLTSVKVKVLEMEGT